MNLKPVQFFGGELTPAQRKVIINEGFDPLEASIWKFECDPEATVQVMSSGREGGIPWKRTMNVSPEGDSVSPLWDWDGYRASRP